MQILPFLRVDVRMRASSIVMGEGALKPVSKMNNRVIRGGPDSEGKKL